MNNYPKVSIVTITYGHEKYITDTLDGIFMQYYPGEIEVIISNDQSPDNTDDIIQNYLSNKNIPNNFNIQYTKHEINKGVVPNFSWALQEATGKYTAICEGDDYWTDPLKLQKQVDFMEANEDCSLCYHKTRVKLADKSREDYFFGAKDIKVPTKFTLEDFIKTNNEIGIRTPAMVIRSQGITTSTKWFIKSAVADLSLQLYYGSIGNYGYLPDEMAVYNRGVPGAWSENNQSVDWRLKQIFDLNATYTLFDENTNYKYHAIIKNRNEDWIKTRIDYIQRNFSRSDQFKIIKQQYKTLIRPDKRNVIIWMRFLLGNQTVKRLVEFRK